MKTVVAMILLLAIIIGAGYYSLPIIIGKRTSGLRAEVQDLKQRLQKIDTDLPATINRVDLLWHEISKLLRVL